MRKLFAMAAMLSLVAVGCNDPEQPQTNFDNYVLELTSSDTMEFTADGGEGVITFSLSDDQTRNSPVPEPLPEVQCEAEWITDLTVDYYEITFTVQPQTVQERRHAVIYAEYGDYNFSVNIFQGEDAPEFDVEYEAAVLNGTYNGKTASKGYNYLVILSDQNAPTSGNQFFGSVQYRLDLYSEVSCGLDFTECPIPNGEYTFDKEKLGNPGSMRAESSYYVRVSESGDPYYSDFVKGKVVITDNHVDAQLLLDNGEWHHVTFDGELVTGGYANPTNERPYSLLTEDFEFNYTTGYLHAYYRGDFYGLGCDVWYVDMCQTVLPMEGTYFMLTLLVDKAKGGYKEDAFLGEYRVADNTATGADLYNTFVAGDLRDGFEIINSWCLTCSYSQILNTWGGPLMDGTIKIEKDGGLYVVTYDCVDDLGNKIVGTFRCGFDGYMNQDGDNPDATITPAE